MAVVGAKKENSSSSIPQCPFSDMPVSSSSSVLLCPIPDIPASSSPSVPQCPIPDIRADVCFKVGIARSKVFVWFSRCFDYPEWALESLKPCFGAAASLPFAHPTNPFLTELVSLFKMCLRRAQSLSEIYRVSYKI